MGKAIRKTGKFYSSIMMENIGIFMFVGLLFVLFQENGWFPDEDMYAISKLVYKYLLPVCIAYTGGVKMGTHTGGILAVLMTAGCVSANESAGILAGMLAAPAAGVCWKYAGEPLKKRTGSGMQMLAGNLLTGMLGCILAGTGYYIISPGLQIISGVLTRGIDTLVMHKMLGALSIIVEPAKILFLNNIVNHGILVPIGMSQLMQEGQSVLFLVETNPGPGFGMLLALYCINREKRGEYAAAMAAQAAGGLHEVYFPEVISNLWLLIPLTAAGAAGTECFVRLGCGLQTPVSPGSVVTILLMAGKGAWIKAGLGIVLSACISFTGSMLVLKIQKRIRRGAETEPGPESEKYEPIQVKESEKEVENMTVRIQKIGFVCDAGVGSSAMGAALFRRKLAQNRIEGMEVEAYACDRIPEGLDLIVCQKDFLNLLPGGLGHAKVCPVESLMSGAEFEKLIAVIQERNG